MVTMPPLILGHRGCVTEPENTLPAFRYALENGADGVEFDVHLTRDGVPVVIHDETVDRTTDGHGHVKDFALAQLQSFKVKNAAGVKIPTLEEVLNLIGEYRVRRPLLINVEIKPRGVAAKTLECLNAYIKKGWGRREFLVASFVHDELRYVKRHAPDFPLGLLYEPENEPTLDAVIEELQPYSINPSLDLLKSKRFNPLAHGKPVICWIGGETPFPGNMPGIKDAALKGIKAIITNYPKEVKAAFSEEK